MVKAADTQSLGALLRVFAEGTRIDRLQLATLSGATGEYFSDSVDASGRLMKAGASAYRAHASVAMLTRLVWSLVPNRLITSACPDFRLLAVKALHARFASASADEDMVRFLTVVFKRIRTYAKLGRQVQSLNFDLVAHRKLLDEQRGRCNHCLYEFGAADHFYAIEDDGLPAESGVLLDGELALSQTFRRPELDHIIPVILGGDGESNWQILCRSCNAGKSDQISYMSTILGRSYNRLGHLYQLTAGKRYAVIAEASTEVETLKGDGRYFRVFKKEYAGLANPENLHAIYS